MGFLDEAKDKAGDLIGENHDKIDEGVDKVADIADEKTGGKFGDQIDQGADMAKEQLDNLGN